MKDEKPFTVFLFAYTAMLLVSCTVAYLMGVEHGRLQGLQCGTDTECEVLEDMLNRK
ncbi:MAG: hypothetical protein ACRCZI_06650 [Cetobacterium sp.]